MPNSIKSLFLLFLGLTLISTAVSASVGVCSFHQDQTCAEYADCVETSETPDGFDCVCREGYEGDGFKNGTKCTNGKTPCLEDSECHAHAECVDTYCSCLYGFTGDGFNVCDDIDECKCSGDLCKCDENANCQNTIGNFTCTCGANYRGDGFTCEFFCTRNEVCHEHGRCVGEQCACRPGYQGDGRFNCTDINECDIIPYKCNVNADCTNTDGSYECTCRNGYTGDGKTCTPLPKTCDEIFKTKPGAADGKYTIDPDGPGPLASMEVDCDMKPDMGVTIMKPTKEYQISPSSPDYEVEYEQSVPQISAVVDQSGFCYQYMSATCRWKAKMLNGDAYWVDGKNKTHYSWGGSKIPGKCECGQISSCFVPESSCNCDGSISGKVDDGQVIDKNLLPVTLVHVGGLTGYQKMDIALGAVTCSPKHSLPKDCHEAKFDPKFNIKEDGPQTIDVDGPNGPASPTLVLCDMTSYPHVGITVVVHDKPDPTVPTGTDSPINYAGTSEEIAYITENSAFCRQDIVYECQDSPITGNTRIVDIDGDEKDYWPGGTNGMCACGLNNQCYDEAKPCNCDTVDGQRRKDFGAVTNKGDLPVTRVLSDNPGTGSTYTVSHLKCSQREFGFEVNCQAYFQKGNEDSYTYWVDPDGPEKTDSTEENVSPFPVKCVMVKEPPHGITVVHHKDESTELLTGAFVLRYYYTKAVDLIALRSRSTYCVQAISFTCSQSPLFDASGAKITWYDIEGNEHAYFNGNGSEEGCACASSGSCDGGPDSKCNCDIGDTQTRMDIGNLIEKENLPIGEIKGSGASVTVGPLQCFDVYPTCSDLYWYMKGKRLESEDMVSNGQYTISPGGADGVQPFKVVCRFPKTEIPITPGDNYNGTQPDGEGPITKCYDITYGNGLSNEQVQSLIDNSRSCTQELKFHCKNAPLIDMVHFKTCDGETQPGWAGSNGEPRCSCGVTGSCDQIDGEYNDCNCQIQDGLERTDKGWIHSKSRLPVCQVCITLAPVTDQQPERSASYEISSLFCASYHIGVFGTCQQRRDSTSNGSPSETVFLDIDGPWGSEKPFPIFCEIHAHPPAGITRINPKDEDKDVPKEGGEIAIQYYVFEFQLIVQVIEKSVFCEQEVYVLCNGADYPTERGPYDDWVLLGDGTIECKEGQCTCENGAVYGGIIKGDLPVKNVIMAASTANRELHIGPLRCYDLYKDCHDIKMHNAINGKNRGHVYAVDPDGPGGVEFFEVLCDFETDPEIGITIIKGTPDEIAIEGQSEPGSQTTEIVYPNVTPEQVNTLTKQSGFCSQGIQYECKETALINGGSASDGYYTTYGGGKSSSFGTGFQTDVEGCACVLTGTCPEGKSCHCDSKGPMVEYDYGIITDRDIMPIVSTSFGGQTSPTASATASVGDVKCGPRPFDLPKDCEEVFKRGFTNSGEFMIWPGTGVEPYIVRCEMELVPGHGVTIIGHNKEDPTPVDKTVTETVTYNNASKEQVEALTDVSLYCYQPIKFDCYNTQFLGYGKFDWTGTGGDTNYYIGSGESGGCSCSGGIDKLCGGDQSKAQLQLRKCSCDAAELQWRSDAGVIANKDDLAVFSMAFRDNGLVNSSGIITLGKLYCSQKEFDINECDTGFNDCHKWADCINKPGTFECRCRPGYHGDGVAGVYANGRNCYDNNECALGLCPHSSDCTNTVGSFQCKCKDGYKQVGPEECKSYFGCQNICEDIDECADPSLNDCSPDAVCTNLPGSYHCRCKRGFRGDGVECMPFGLCSCFGDPHCLSYDAKFLHFQGDCQYIMSQDGCNGTEQTFQVLNKHWNKDIPGLHDATWIKKVTFKFLGHVVELEQNHVVLVDGYKKTLPVNHANMLIHKRGRWIEVLTKLGVQVNWDGYEKVEVNVPQNYRDKMCGLCGNYNSDPSDDWTVGDACAGAGEVTTNADKFGNSYVDVNYKDTNPQCNWECNPPPPPKVPCGGLDMDLAKFYCEKIFAEGSKFQTCLQKLDGDLAMRYEDACIFDLCKVTDNRHIVMCAHAENLVKECQDNYDTTITDWRTQDMCEPSCPENMEYLECGNMERVKNCDNRTTTITSMTQPTEQCLADCYCKENMYMDGNQCVEFEKCGCLYMDSYYSAGETYVDDKCENIHTCTSSGDFTSRPLTCSENATCSLESGVYGCHCKQGFMGDGETCEFNPCGSKPCNENENCLVVDDSYICECQMGFQGDCNHCEDIDECATKTHDCPPHSRCKNTVGSFTCDCIPGYEKENGRCKDINECKVGTDTCGDGTKCYNTPGSYHCEPCSDHSPDNKCCTCYGGKCNNVGKLCGTDGVTYNSEKDLIIARCKKGKKINVDYKGECISGACPTENICPKYQECITDPMTNMPTCVCKKCQPPEEIYSEVKVCSDKLTLFSNICVFKMVMCSMDREDTIIENTTKPCEGKQGVDLVTEWSEWSPCSTTCGNGTMTRQRNALVEYDDWMEENYPLSSTVQCIDNKPCPGGTCDITSPCNISQLCFDSETGDALCTCPDCTDHGEDPVCGKVGSDVTKTYENQCELMKAACEATEPYLQLYPEPCGTKPLNCTKMARLEVIKNDRGCMSSSKINLGACDGGCGAYANKCCKPTTKRITVDLGCPDLTLVAKEVDVIESCDCVPLET